MSLLNQLKSHSNALQQHGQAKNFQVSTALTETEYQKAWAYLFDLARQLTVIEPPGSKLTLDRRTCGPAMKPTNFRVDSRKKETARQGSL